MLAAKTPGPDFDYFSRGPVLVSPKIDGVRAIVRDGKLVSRALKLIPNRYTQALFGRPELEGLDGELVVGSARGNDVMQRTTSGVMSIAGEPDVTFWVFDDTSEDEGFCARLALAEERLQYHSVARATPVYHTLVTHQQQLDDLEAYFLDLGYEGAMVRAMHGAYKQGRSTAKEGGLIKLKRFEDSEAIVVGYEERMHNGNVATVDNLGHTKRSTHQANKTGLGDLGALVCAVDSANYFGGDTRTFNIGTGFTAWQRQELWLVRESLPGRIAKFRHFTAAGVKDAPRFPVFVGFRNPLDMST
jgi:DNA ligase-1